MAALTCCHLLHQCIQWQSFTVDGDCDACCVRLLAKLHLGCDASCMQTGPLTPPLPCSTPAVFTFYVGFFHSHPCTFSCSACYVHPFVHFLSVELAYCMHDLGSSTFVGCAMAEACTNGGWLDCVLHHTHVYFALLHARQCSARGAFTCSSLDNVRCPFIVLRSACGKRFV